MGGAIIEWSRLAQHEKRIMEFELKYLSITAIWWRSIIMSYYVLM